MAATGSCTGLDLGLQTFQPQHQCRYLLGPGGEHRAEPDVGRAYLIGRRTRCASNRHAQDPIRPEQLVGLPRRQGSSSPRCTPSAPERSAQSTRSFTRVNTPAARKHRHRAPHPRPRVLALAGSPGGAGAVKRALGRAAWTSVRDAVAVLRAAGVLTLVNDRVDWALLSGADGVHVGDEDLPPREARRLLGPDRVLGVTVRGAAGAREAAAAGATYVGLGPVFATRTKEVPAPVLGLEHSRTEVQASPLPVVAIGGIGLETVMAVAGTGVHGVAVVSDLWVGGDAASASRRCTRLPLGRPRGLT